MSHRAPAVAIRWLASLLLCLTAAAEASGQTQPTGEIDLLALAEDACADPEQAELCALLRAKIADAAVQSLLVVGASGQRAEAVATVRDFADWPEAIVRYAAATALGGLHPAEEDTPVLAALLNDPVPAVRVAALGSLGESSDPMARRLLERARDRENQGIAMVPDPAPVDPAALPIELPEGTVPVYFTDDREDGIAAYVTDAAPEAVLAELSAQVGGEAFDLAGLAALYTAEGPPIDMSDPIALMQYMAELKERVAQLPPDQQQQAYLEAMQELAASQQASAESTAHLDRWRDDDLYGNPMAVVLPADPAVDATAPTRIVLVYEDITLGRTGLALQWVAPAEMPPAPEPSPDEEAASTETATLFGLQSTPADRTLSQAEVEERVWAGIVAMQDPEAARDFIELFPDSAYAAEAAELQASWAALPPIAWGEDDHDQTTTTTDDIRTEPPEPERQQSSLFGRPAPDSTPTLETENATFADNEAIVVRYRGLPLGANRRQWIALAAAGAPDTSWGPWSYVEGAEGEVSLPHQPPGAHEVRAYLESPRGVIARLPITVVPVDPDAATVPALEPDKDAFAVGEAIGVRWSGMPGDRSDWITVVPVGTPDTTWGDWLFTDRNPSGRLTLPAQDEPGDYEIRAYLESPREVIARIPITVTP